MIARWIAAHLGAGAVGALAAYPAFLGLFNVIGAAADQCFYVILLAYLAGLLVIVAVPILAYQAIALRHAIVPRRWMGFTVLALLPAPALLFFGTGGLAQAHPRTIPLWRGGCFIAMDLYWPIGLGLGRLCHRPPLGRADTVARPPREPSIPPLVALCRAIAGGGGNGGGSRLYVRPDPRAHLAGAAAFGRADLRRGGLSGNSSTPANERCSRLEF